MVWRKRGDAVDTTHGIVRRDPADRVDEGDSGMCGDGVKGMGRVKRRVSDDRAISE
jgi:hypothetical protein